MFVFLFIFVIFNLSFLVKYITRFTEDCFASLVALIFILDAIRNVLDLRTTYPINYQPDLPLDYSCACVFNGMNPNKTILYNITQIGLSNATTLNGTLKSYCKQFGGSLNGTGCETPIYAPNIFFFSVLLFIFTFLISMGLKEFRTSAFFPSKVRRIIIFCSKIFLVDDLGSNDSK